MSFEQPTFLFTWIVLCLFGVICCLTFLFLSKRILSKEIWGRLAAATTASLVVLLLAEGVLRITGYAENYSEARMGHYSFICHGCYQDTLHVWPANATHDIGDGVQFLYPRTTNSLGLSDREWTKEKPDSVYRIIALGDSFTEGDGAPADSSWPKLLENQLANVGKPVEVFNAGVCGSDPFHSMILLKKELMAYRPDLVIVTVAMQDFLEDIAVRGGAERFDPARGRMPKAFELVYAYSHIARLVYNRVLGYSWVLIRENSDGFKKQMTEKHIPELMAEFGQLQKENEGIQLEFVLYPHQIQVQDGYTPFLLQALRSNAELNGLRMMDIRPCYEEMIKQSERPVHDFWWKNDGHHNSDGYLMMAHCIAKSLAL